MRILSEDEAKTLIDRNPEDTCVISIETNNAFGDGYIIHATLENRDDLKEYPDGYIMNRYGKSGWSISKEDFAERIAEAKKYSKTGEESVIDAIVCHQGYVSGNMYLYDDTPIVDDYMNPQTYDAEKIIYIYATNEEILAWLPYLAETVNGELVAYGFIVQPRSEIIEAHFREQEHNYYTEDAKYAINDHFELEEDDIPSEKLDASDLKEYEYLTENIDEIIAVFEKRSDTENGDYYVWQVAIQEVLENFEDEETEND